MELIYIVFISFATFLTRIINLLSVPIFTDEAIYIRWAQIGVGDPAQRFISLTDGKQPLFTWLMYPALKIFNDPLFAGRFISVLAGVGSCLGLYFAARALFGRKTAVFTSLFYLFSPFALIYDRLALMDSLLAMFTVWSLYLEIILIRKIRLDIAMLLGVSIGLGLLTKSSALFCLLMLPFSLILFDCKPKHKIKRLLKWAGLATVSLIIAEVMYNLLRLSPWFYIIGQKNYSFIMTFSEFMKSRFAIFWPNMDGLWQFVVSYLTIPVLIVLIIGLIFGIIRRDRKILYVFIWFVVPFLALAAFGKVLFPRFILFMVLPLFIITGNVLANFTYFAWKKMRIFLLILPVIFAYPAYVSYLAIFSPVDLPIHKIDRDQLFDEWPSGYGVREVIDYLAEKAKTEKIVIGTEGTFGLNPAVYEIYFGTDKNVEIKGYWPMYEVPKDLLEDAKTHPTYLIFKERQDALENWPITLIKKIRRGKGKTYLLFYQVNPVKL